MESNHSEANRVSNPASTSRHFSRVFTTGTGTATNTADWPAGFESAAPSNGIANVASANHTATGIHASTSRPSVTSCRAAPAARIPARAGRDRGAPP